MRNRVRTLGAPGSLLLVLLLLGGSRPVIGQQAAGGAGAAPEREEAEPEEAASERRSGPTAALAGGRPLLSLRYRYEEVRDDGVGPRPARASTLRTAFGYQTGVWRGFSLLLEAENVALLGNDLYNNAGAGGLANGAVDRPVVADPAGTELQQGFLEWRGGDTRVRVGREELALGDQRFVGNVGWRQNHQSYDAVTMASDRLDRVSLFYGFLDNIHRINGGSHPLAAHLGNLALDLEDRGRVTLYGYWLDYEGPERPGLSTRTLGAEWAGERSPGDRLTLRWEVEHAEQRAHADNPNRVDAAYTFLMLEAGAGPVSLKAGYEVLGGGGANGAAFQTPLATLHKFNGWADKFLVTPPDGLVDLHLEVSGIAGPIGWLVRYHDFRADRGGADFGTELDLQALYTTRWKQGFGLKAALYEADRLGRDTEKWWFFTTWGI